jgi:serine/threonine protein kinase
VYKASWHGTDVAVKVLKDEQTEHTLLLEGEAIENIQRQKLEQERQFQNEATLLSTLRHPNIVNFLGFLMHGDEVRLRDFTHGWKLNSETVAVN